MTIAELQLTLQNLRNLTAENEIVEFKEAKTGYDFTKLGRYFSALSNEANLKGKPNAWLVFGVEDKHHYIVGSHYRTNRKDLDSLKSEIADKTTNRITFIEIHELNLSEGRVIMFQIPAAPKGIPVAFEGHYCGRNSEDLGPLNIEELERIRGQVITDDWSAAIILLGRDESEHLVNPAEAKIRWILLDNKGNQKDYMIVGTPLLLAVDKVYAKIRNLKYRYLKEGTLFPEEIDQYEPFTIREAINNCIAHQDYKKAGRINVIEMEDQLVFTNLGSFIPGSVEKVVIEDAPEEHYRNRFLAMAMFNLKMVDTAGGGIKKMFNFQRERMFPLPDYDLSGGRVKVTISGKVLDLEYARLLARNQDLTLEEIIMLDKVQIKKPLTSSEEKYLKAKMLIEGRKPNFYIGIRVAQQTGQKAAYSKNKAFDKIYYLDLIVKAIREHGSVNRSDVNDLLWNKLPDRMNDKQKKNKVNNLLSELRSKDTIKNDGSDKSPKWILITNKD